MERGELAFTKVGSRRLIPLASLKAVLARGLVNGEAAVEPGGGRSRGDGRGDGGRSRVE